jgi:hypothetical protein
LEQGFFTRYEGEMGEDSTMNERMYKKREPVGSLVVDATQVSDMALIW